MTTRWRLTFWQKRALISCGGRRTGKLPTSLTCPSTRPRRAGTVINLFNVTESLHSQASRPLCCVQDQQLAVLPRLEPVHFGLLHQQGVGDLPGDQHQRILPANYYLVGIFWSTCGL